MKPIGVNLTVLDNGTVKNLFYTPIIITLTYNSNKNQDIKLNLVIQDLQWIFFK